MNKHSELSSWFVIIGILISTLLAIIALIAVAWAIVYVFIVIYEFVFGLLPPLLNFWEFTFSKLGIDFNSNFTKIYILFFITYWLAKGMARLERSVL